MQSTASLLNHPATDNFSDYYPSSHAPISRHFPSSKRVISGTMKASSSLDIIKDDQEEQDSYRQSEPENRIRISCSTSQPVHLSSSPAAQFLSAFSSSPRAQDPLPDDEGQVVAGYTLGSTIGHGGFSTIRRAFSSSGGVVAVKIVRRNDLGKQPNAFQAQKKLDHEAHVWASLSHEHILPLFSAVHTSYADYFVTLYCPAGSLFDILKRDGRPALPHDDAGMMFRQVVRGLRYMHEVTGYVHRDVKLENVLVDEMGVCRIGDFGMSQKIGEIDEEDEDDEEQAESHAPIQHGGVHRAASMALPASKRQAFLSVTRHASIRHRNSTSSPNPKALNPGSLPYAAPELLLPRATPLAPHPSQDIWALGVMLYALLTGRLPFTDSFEPRLQMKICNGIFEIPPDIGRGAERVLRGCLQRNVDERWTIALVDDVAWGVGWKTEDDVDEEDADADSSALLQSSRTSRSCSRTRSAIDQDGALVEQTHQEASKRRSDSRLRRSSSRPPALAARSSSSRSSRHRRRSRSSSPTFGDLNTAVLSNGNLSLSSCYSPSYESTLLVSPSSSLGRGRRPARISGFYTSRSPSPSVVPFTPVDSTTQFREHTVAPPESETAPRKSRCSPSRDNLRSLLHHPHFMDDAPIPETGVSDWTTRGLSFMSLRAESRSRRREEHSTTSVSTEDHAPLRNRRQPRAESMPPVSTYGPLPSWSLQQSRGRQLGVSMSATEDRRFLTPLSTPLLVPPAGKPVAMPRSRSAGYARNEQEFYPFRPCAPLQPI